MRYRCARHTRLTNRKARTTTSTFVLIYDLELEAHTFPFCLKPKSQRSTTDGCSKENLPQRHHVVNRIAGSWWRCNARKFELGFCVSFVSQVLAQLQQPFALTCVIQVDTSSH